MSDRSPRDDLDALISGASGDVDPVLAALVTRLEETFVEDPDELTSRRHLTAISKTIRSARRSWAPALSRAAAVFVAATLGFSAIASAGALPAPLQRFAATTGALVGVSVPRPTIELPTLDPEPHPEPESFPAPTPRTPPTATAPQIEEPALPENGPSAPSGAGRESEEPTQSWNMLLCDGTAVRIRFRAEHGSTRFVDAGGIDVTVESTDSGFRLTFSDGTVATFREGRRIPRITARCELVNERDGDFERGRQEWPPRWDRDRRGMDSTRSDVWWGGDRTTDDAEGRATYRNASGDGRSDNDWHEPDREEREYNP